MSFAWAVPNTMPFVGLQPLTIDAKFVNGNASTAMAVGSFQFVDLRGNRATKIQPGPGGASESIWSTAVTPGAASLQETEKWTIAAIYMHKENGKKESLAAGETGVFRLCGITKALVNVPDAADAGKGRPLAWSQTASLIAGLDVRGDTTDLGTGYKIYGFTLESIATAGADTTVSTDIMFCGFGIGMN